jgi:hypothetical protein
MRSDLKTEPVAGRQSREVGHLVIYRSFARRHWAFAQQSVARPNPSTSRIFSCDTSHSCLSCMVSGSTTATTSTWSLHVSCADARTVGLVLCVRP